MSNVYTTDLERAHNIIEKLLKDCNVKYEHIIISATGSRILGENFEYKQTYSVQITTSNFREYKKFLKPDEVDIIHLVALKYFDELEEMVEYITEQLYLS